MKKIEVIIFDGGGTIWYSMRVLWEHYKAGFLYLGLTNSLDDFPYSLEICNELSSLEGHNSRWNIAKTLIALFMSSADPNNILEETEPAFTLNSLINTCKGRIGTGAQFEHLCAKLGFFLEEALYSYDERRYPPCEKIIFTLSQLHNDGFRLALLSNRRKTSVEKILRALNLHDGLFERIEAPDQHEPAEKDVHSFVRDMKVASDRAVFVGDSAIDIMSARKSGSITTIGVLSGMGTRRTLKRAGADYIIRDAQEVRTIIAELNKNEEK